MKPDTLRYASEKTAGLREEDRLEEISPGAEGGKMTFEERVYHYCSEEYQGNMDYKEIADLGRLLYEREKLIDALENVLQYAECETSKHYIENCAEKGVRNPCEVCKAGAILKEVKG